MADERPPQRLKPDECIVEPILPDERYLSTEKSPEHQRRHIRDYMASQAANETITHLEKVTTEVVYGRSYDVWDVHTDKHRWWVVTLPTNLYSQLMFPSMDMCLTFHLGLSARLFGADKEPDEVGQILIRASRRMDTAIDSLDHAREVEDFQSVGVKLREALLALLRELADPAIVPAGAEQPKLADFVHWSEYIVDSLTQSDGLKHLRPMLKAFAKDVWQAANGLTHSTTADKARTTLIVQAGSHLFGQVFTLLRLNTEEPSSACPNCGSLRVYHDVRVVGDDIVTMNLCEVCFAEWGVNQAQA